MRAKRSRQGGTYLFSEVWENPLYVNGVNYPERHFSLGETMIQ